MKIFIFVFIAVLTLTAFENSDNSGIITMTTSAESASFQLRGTGTAIVDTIAGIYTAEDSVRYQIGGKLHVLYLRPSDSIPYKNSGSDFNIRKWYLNPV